MKEQKISAIDIKRGTTVGLPTGGSVVAQAGAVLLVPNEVSPEDAAYLCAMGKAKPCDPRLKAERAKASAKDEK